MPYEEEDTCHKMYRIISKKVLLTLADLTYTTCLACVPSSLNLNPKP
jgi:hypothetical protein